MTDVVAAYRSSKRRLLVLGYNATLTTNMEAPRQPKRQFEQVKALAKVNPRVMQSVSELCQVRVCMCVRRAGVVAVCARPLFKSGQ